MYNDLMRLNKDYKYLGGSGYTVRPFRKKIEKVVDGKTIGISYRVINGEPYFLDSRWVKLNKVEINEAIKRQDETIMSKNMDELVTLIIAIADSIAILAFATSLVYNSGLALAVCSLVMMLSLGVAIGASLVSLRSDRAKNNKRFLLNMMLLSLSDRDIIL